MAALIYSVITSLDGFVADVQGNFGWAMPDEELHAAVNDLERPIGTYLYGRRMYEVMRYWDTPAAVEDQSEVAVDYAEIWRAANKTVYSSTLGAASTSKTRIERQFDPDGVRRLKETAEADLSVGGPELAAHALRAGLVDECHLFLTPIVVGGGQHWLPGGLCLELELLDERRFGNGVVQVHYRVAR